MRPEDRDYARMYDMLACCNRLVALRVMSSLEQLLASEDLQDIVIRRLIVLGEAARQVSEGTKARWSHVPWKDAISLRNLVVHEYAHADMEILWDIMSSDLPRLKAQLELVLGPSDHTSLP